MNQFITTTPDDLIDITIDFETFYSTDVSLSKMSTAQYVMDQEFEIIGFAMKIADKPTKWYSSHIGKPHYKMLFDTIPWERVRLICHNALFDAAILYWHFGVKPARYFCTMQGARKDIVPHCGGMSLKVIADFMGLGAKGSEIIHAKGLHRKDFTPEGLARYADYCLQDTDLCNGIYKELKPMFDPDEEMMLHLTIRKGVIPQARWNAQTLADGLLEERMMKTRIMQTIDVDKKDLMSNPKFAKLLEDHGVTPPLKISPTTGKQTFAFAKADLAFQALQEHPDRKVRALVSARLGVKSTLMETRLERLSKIGICLKGGATFPLLYYGAHTGRLSGMDKINMQNPPRGSPIRYALEAGGEHTLVAGDLSQVEARITAWLAGQEDMVSQFRNGEDVYSLFADTLYGMEQGTTNKDDYPNERFMGKTCILGLGFGLGGANFALQVSSKGVPTTSEEGDAIVATYRSAFPQIKKLWWTMGDMISMGAKGGAMRYKCLTMDGNRMLLPGGRYIEYPDLYKDANKDFHYRGNRKQWKKLYGAKLTENVVQALAQIIIRDIELQLARVGIFALGQVHDELIFRIRTNKVHEFVPILERLMVVPPTWAMDLPLDCDVASAQNYAECK